MTYDRKDIMIEAWAIIRRFLGNGESLRTLLSRALKSAWFKAKMEASARASVTRKKAAAEKRIEALADHSTADLLAMARQVENRDTLTDRDRADLADLRAAVSIAGGREAAKRDLIAASAGRFCAVTFIKKDGTERTMQVQPAKLAMHVKGDEATDTGKRAAATRKARHPNLLPVWDTQAKAPRSINLATVRRIAVDGVLHTYP